MPTPPSQIYYCRIRNCQRKCGLVHRDSSRKRYQFSRAALSLDTAVQEKDSTTKANSTPDTKKRGRKKARSQRSIGTNSSTTASNDSSGRGSQNQNSEEYAPKQHLSTFEEIMERAMRKISDVNLQDSKSVSPSSVRPTLSEKRLRMAPSVSLDTTTIHFDQPVWDNPKLREELLDSEEDFALDASPPSLREDTVAVDKIISEATHAVDYNPIDHDRRDEMISGWSSDDDDYSTLDLSQVRRVDEKQTVILPIRRRHLKDVAYEPSIDVADRI